jgi:hypothetical protein
MPVDENAARRPEGFRGDVPIPLGDGQTYFLPRPVVTFGIVLSEEGKPSFKRTDLGFGSPYMEVLQRFHDTDDFGVQMGCLAEMVLWMLRLNYDLSDVELAALLPYRPSDAVNQKMWGDLTEVATGNPSPKGDPEDDGSDWP